MSGYQIFAMVHGDPRPEPRPRATLGADGKARVYVPNFADDWKRTVREAVAAQVAVDLAFTHLPIESAFEVDLVFRFRRPKNHWRTGRFAGRIKPRWRIVPHTNTPDIDNLAKAVLDCIGAWRKKRLLPLVWLDDAQVIRLDARKRWVREGEVAGVDLVLTEVVAGSQEALEAA